MWGDYGYIEDETGKTYDTALLKRFAGYAVPYWPVLLVTCILILVATGAELLLPYMTKVAIDRYIVATDRKIDLRNQDSLTAEETDRLKKLLDPTGTNGLFFISNEKLKQLDPAYIRRLEAEGILSREEYYVTDYKAGETSPKAELLAKRSDVVEFHPEAAAIKISDLESLDHEETALLRSDDIKGLSVIAIICFTVILLGYFCDLFHVILIEYSGQKISHDLRLHLVKHVLDQSIAFHDSHPTGRLVARLTNDIQNLGEMIKSVAVSFFKDAVILGGIIVMLIHLNLKLALATFSLIPLIIVITMVFGKKAREAFRELRAKVAQINTAFSETIAGIRIIQAFLREARNIKSFQALNHLNYLAGMRQIHVFAVFMPLIEILSSATLAIIIWYGGLNVLNETITLGVIVAFIGYSRKFFQPIREMAEKFNILQSAMASLERIFVLLDQRESLPEKGSAADRSATRGEIVFDHVHFEYKPGEPVLKNVTFDVKAGETMAIVGATGSGKTSIINLLLRFYDVKSGRITIDGEDIRNLPLANHRSRIGLVMQDVFLFDGSVMENISLSRDVSSEHKIKQAAAAVGAEDFINTLPDGYNQVLGEGGRSLSLGQRQLLSFARVLAQDPEILVLDEATAFIDSESEKLIEKALGKLTSNRTSIIIAHRLSTIQRADKILVIKKGNVIESGSHRELLANQGYYYRLYQLQMTDKDSDQAIAGDVD